MQSLYNLTENLLAIYDALEENGGELTDELAAALDETDQAIALKADHYASFIRMIRDRAAAADAEIKRLQSIKRVAQNAEKAIRGHIADYMAATGRDGPRPPRGRALQDLPEPPQGARRRRGRRPGSLPGRHRRVCRDPSRLREGHGQHQQDGHQGGRLPRGRPARRRHRRGDAEHNHPLTV